MNKEELNAVATDAFNQAEDGLAVPLDPEEAEGIGIFTEDAVTLSNVLDDLIHRIENAEEENE